MGSFIKILILEPVVLYFPQKQQDTVMFLNQLPLEEDVEV